ncbi:MAG: E7 protein [Varecia variegata papillomavirus 1]|nr:MAG: E7 protein [Varecia variegata papillomavirus 1]
MIGKEATIKDIELYLEELVCPVSLLSDETLPPEEVPEEELQESSYRITLPCRVCDRNLRLFVVASNHGISSLNQLLFQGLGIICPGCAKEQFRNGRR